MLFVSKDAKKIINRIDAIEHSDDIPNQVMLGPLLFKAYTVNSNFGYTIDIINTLSDHKDTLDTCRDTKAIYKAIMRLDSRNRDYEKNGTSRSLKEIIKRASELI